MNVKDRITVSLVGLRFNIPLDTKTGQLVDILLRHSVRMILKNLNITQLEMWANAQPDGRPAKYRWRPLFNAAKFG